ncbi:hypothetical protein T492DRAFT_906573, partial [Pavlovales sp. CCMP2436]
VRPRDGDPRAAVQRPHPSARRRLARARTAARLLDDAHACAAHARLRTCRALHRAARCRVGRWRGVGANGRVYHGSPWAAQPDRPAGGEALGRAKQRRAARLDASEARRADGARRGWLRGGGGCVLATGSAALVGALSAHGRPLCGFGRALLEIP